jgi:hypothetical protein
MPRKTSTPAKWQALKEWPQFMGGVLHARRARCVDVSDRIEAASAEKVNADDTNLRGGHIQVACNGLRERIKAIHGDHHARAAVCDPPSS